MALLPRESCWARRRHSPGNRVALVIGQSAYRVVMPLPNPANDAKAVAQLLGDAGFEVDDIGRSVAERFAPGHR